MWGDGDNQTWDTYNFANESPDHFKYIANCRRFEHTFSNPGHYNMALAAYNSAGSYSQVWQGIDVVDCSQLITNSQLTGSVFVDWNNTYHFWAGRYELSDFYSGYNNNNVQVGACDEIILESGVTIEPSAGKEIIFFIDDCLQSSGDKSLQYDDYIVEHKTKCLPPEVQKSMENNHSSDVILFPNPNNGVFMLRFSNPETIVSKIEIFDALGQIIATPNSITGKNLFIDISSKNVGIYYVKICYEDKSDVFKVIYSTEN